MKKYFKPTLGVVLAIATLIGCSSTKAKNAADEQSSAGASQTTTSQSTTDQTAASTPAADTLEGCVFKRHTEIYLEPASGGAATKISSSGKDVSANVGQNVRLSGNTQNPSSTGSSSGNMSGSSTGTNASGEPEFVVTRVDVVAKECPADIQSRVDQDKKSKK